MSKKYTVIHNMITAEIIVCKLWQTINYVPNSCDTQNIKFNFFTLLILFYLYLFTIYFVLLTF